MLYIALLSSCKKDFVNNPASPDATAASGYTPITAGSYWMYDNYLVDSNDTATYFNTDSVYIAGDTTINSITYKRMEGAWMGASDA